MHTRRFEKFIFSLPAYMVCIFLICPFLFFCLRLEFPAWPKGNTFFLVFLMTVFQAGISTVLSLLLGLLGSRGLLSLTKKNYYFLIEGICPAPLPYTSFTSCTFYSASYRKYQTFSFWPDSSHFCTNFNLYRTLRCSFLLVFF